MGVPSHKVTSIRALKNYICCFQHGCLRSLLENIASPQTILALLVVLEILDSQSMRKTNQIPEPRASSPSLSPRCDGLMPSPLWWTSASINQSSPNQSFLHQVVSKIVEFFIWSYQCRSRYYRTICFCLLASLFETGSHYVSQAGLELTEDSLRRASASPVLGIIRVS